MAGNANSFNSARQLALLGIVLQLLHVLFGITAIIGVLVAQAKIKSTEGTPYHSHLRWQIATFWIALVGYAVGTYLWINQQYPYVMMAVLAWVFYRIVVNAYYWHRTTAIERTL